MDTMTKKSGWFDKPDSDWKTQLKESSPWFSKIRTRQEALQIIKEVSTLFLIIAGIAALVGLATDPYRLLDVVVLSIFALSLRSWKCRTMAVGLLCLTLIDLSLFFHSNLGGGGRPGLMGGFLLQLFKVWAATRAVEATWKLQGTFSTEEELAAMQPPRWLTRIGYYVGVPIVAVFGLLVVVGILTETGIIPSGTVLPGEKLTGNTKALFIENGILEPTENVTFFYPSGFFSPIEQGSVLTDHRVIAYEEIEDEVRVQATPINQIDKVEVQRDPDTFLDTQVHIFPKYGESFSLGLSTYEEGDTKFIQALEHKMGKGLTASVLAPHQSTHILDLTMTNDKEIN